MTGLKNCILDLCGVHDFYDKFSISLSRAVKSRVSAGTLKLQTNSVPMGTWQNKGIKGNGKILWRRWPAAGQTEFTSEKRIHGKR